MDSEIQLSGNVTAASNEYQSGDDRLGGEEPQGNDNDNDNDGNNMQPQLYILSPKPGEILYIDSVATIRWVSSMTLATATIKLDDGTVIASSISVGGNTFAYQWKVAASTNISHAITLQGSTTDGVLLNATTDRFLIQGRASIIVLTPEPGAVLRYGEQTDIR